MMYCDALELNEINDDLNYMIVYTFNRKDIDLNLIEKVKDKKIPLADSKGCININIPQGLTNDDMIKEGAYNSKLYYVLSVQDVSDDVINLKIEWMAQIVTGKLYVKNEIIEFKSEVNYTALNDKTREILEDVYKVNVKKARFVA